MNSRHTSYTNLGVRLLILFYLLTMSCVNNTTRPANTKNYKNDAVAVWSVDSIQNELITVGKGYGFDILKNGKVYIHQPMIPCVDGIYAFAHKEDAQSLSTFLVNRLRSKNFNFLLQKFELDSLTTQNMEKIRLETESSHSSVRPVFVKDQLQEKTFSATFAEAPRALVDPPFKKKWTVKENVPFGYRGGSFSFAIGRLVYVGSGEYYSSIIRDFWCYNTETEAWTCLAEIPARCFSGIAFSLLGKGYAGLGTETGTSSGKFEKRMFEYNPETNTWKRINDFPGTARIDASVFVINNRAYAGTGYDGANTRNFYEYNPENGRWRPIADFPGGDIHASVGIGTGKKGFLVAGSRAPHDFKFVYEYIPFSNTWVRRKDLPGLPRYFLAGTFVDTNYIMAGDGGSYVSDKRLRDFYMYDVANDSWSILPDYPADTRGNSRPCGANSNGKAFFGTGFNGDYTNDWNVFEYYFSVRGGPGDYRETNLNPFQYNGKWELFQECSSDDCFAGAEIKSNESLGDFSYSSRFTNRIRTTEVKIPGKEMLLFPRNFALITSRQPRQPVSLRLFFTKAEIERVIDECNQKNGTRQAVENIVVLQCNEAHPDTEPANNTFQKNAYLLIKPQWFGYGYNNEMMVAEFTVDSLHSEFYLAIAVE